MLGGLPLYSHQRSRNVDAMCKCINGEKQKWQNFVICIKCLYQKRNTWGPFIGRPNPLVEASRGGINIDQNFIRWSLRRWKHFGPLLLLASKR